MTRPMADRIPNYVPMLERGPLQAVEARSTPTRPNGGMAPQRQAFVREYLIDFNAGHAAIRAGYAPTNASKIGVLLLKVPAVRDAVARATAERAKRVGFNSDRVLELLGKILLGDPRAVFDQYGGLKKPGELNDDDAMMISGVKTRRIVEVNPDSGDMQQVEIQEIKVVDKMAAMTLAMRHLGMLKDSLDVNVGGPLAEQLAAALARQEGGENIQTEIVGTDGLTLDDYRQLQAEEGEIVDAEVVEPEDDGLTEAQRKLLYGE
jgi:phage terminase small subunit